MYVSARKLLKRCCLKRITIILTEESLKRNSIVIAPFWLTSFIWNVNKILLKSYILYFCFAYTWPGAYSYILKPKHPSRSKLVSLCTVPANILYRPDIGPILDSISAQHRLPISAQCRMCNSATHRADIGNRYRQPTCSRYCADIQRSSLFLAKTPFFDC